MIGRLTGIVSEKSPPFFILDVSGIGYLIQSSLSTFNHIKEGQEVTLYTRCVYKDEEAFIFGFLSKEELKIFEQLITVSGIGPKSGLNILSSFSPEEISEAVESENIELLSSVPKIGKKIASKIILELKGKLKFEQTPEIFTQAVNALCSLGITRNEAVQRVKGLPQNLTLEEMVKQALRK